VTGSSRPYYLAAAVGLVGGLCLLGVFLGSQVARMLVLRAARTPNVLSTLQALIPTATESVATSTLTPTATPGAQPSGHIVLTCQIFKFQSSEQICIVNADGSGYRRLTPEDGIRHYYPSMAPDGRSVVYSQYREPNVYEIYELSLVDGLSRRLTDRLGALNGPEISPDGKSIVFERWTPASNQDQIWLMDRDGGDPHRLFSGTGWDPTWSPDGSRLLFASDMSGSIQLYEVSLDGTGLHRITDMPALRGRSDWSSRNHIATYSGEAWQREIYVMSSDGSDSHQVSPAGGNSQGPSFSPDGQWIAFTGYFDKFKDDNGCEIYIMRTDGSDLRRLTNNEYCDYQPRWGP
jgi:TolB protein